MPQRIPYQPFYCEENVWQLASQLDESDGEVWFLLNRRAQVLAARQRAAEGEPYLVWDYHVVYCSPRDGVYDPDTLCGLPCPAAEYLECSFAAWLAPVGPVPRLYAPFFRVLPATVYLRDFASTREHMLALDGSYLQSPPPWPLIGRGNRLPKFIDIDDDTYGEVFSLQRMQARFAPR